MADTIIGIKELHRNLKRVADAAAKGKRFTVVRDSKPVFRIEPIAMPGARVHTIEDFFALTFKHKDRNLSKKIDKIVYGGRR